MKRGPAIALSAPGGCDGRGAAAQQHSRRARSHPRCRSLGSGGEGINAPFHQMLRNSRSRGTQTAEHFRPDLHPCDQDCLSSLRRSTRLPIDPPENPTGLTSPSGSLSGGSLSRQTEITGRTHQPHRVSTRRAATASHSEEAPDQGPAKPGCRVPSTETGDGASDARVSMRAVS